MILYTSTEAQNEVRRLSGRENFSKTMFYKWSYTKQLIPTAVTSFGDRLYTDQDIKKAVVLVRKMRKIRKNTK